MRVWSFCPECLCSQDGSFSDACDPVTGWCLCRPHFHGPNCDTCTNGYWKSFLTGRCEPCNCDPTTSFSDTCDQVGGQSHRMHLGNVMLVGLNMNSITSSKLLKGSPAWFAVDKVGLFNCKLHSEKSGVNFFGDVVGYPLTTPLVSLVEPRVWRLLDLFLW